MSSAVSAEAIESYVSVERGEIDRRVFSDPDIFELEMEHIFGRAWLFLCHESQIRKPGDFFEAPMGRDNVLVVRQRDRSIKAFLNTCSHRGNAVCRAEEGNVKNFMCTYHGWTFDLGGNLVGVPGRAEFYGEDLDMSKHPLKKVAQLESYEGFVFATFDETAPTLSEFLGATGRLALDLLAAKGDLEIVPGIQKFVIDCNWKFTVDNLFDFYHPQITHMSALAVVVDENNIQKQVDDDNGARATDGSDLGVRWTEQDLDNIVVLGEYGQAIAGPTAETILDVPGVNLKFREAPGFRERFGPVGSRVAGHAGIFPTTWITGTAQISLRIPLSPTKTEIWWFSFVDKSAPEHERKQTIDLQNHIFGPAGMLEQEDGENWAQSTMQTFGRASRQVPQLLKMGLGRGKIRTDDGLHWIEGTTNEHAQVWTYAAWKEWVLGRDWAELKRRTTPGEFI